jgi:hypothetical protein
MKEPGTLAVPGPRALNHIGFERAVREDTRSLT